MRNPFVFLTTTFCLSIHPLLFAKRFETVNHKKFTNVISLPFPEKSLLGIQLFDPSQKIVNKYGSPHLLQDAEPKEQNLSEDTVRSKKQIIKTIKWIYKNNNSQYAFTIDENGRVIQIECIGLQDNKAVTSKKIKLGDELSKVINAYGAPENYSLMDEYSVVRYSTTYHLSFKLSNMKIGQPLKVVGITLNLSKTINEKKDDTHNNK